MRETVYKLRRRTRCRLNLINHQRRVHVDMSLLLRIGTLALPSCLDKQCENEEATYYYPSTIEVSIVSDKIISFIHKQFLRVHSATDVITFPYGEVMISAETTFINSRIYGHSPTIEIAICLIHGLLHLNGYNDQTALQAERMSRKQTDILQAVHRKL